MAVTVKASDVRNAGPGSERKTPPVVWWAIAGGFFALLTVYVWGSWIISGDAHAINAGPNVPTGTKALAWIVQTISVLLLIAAIVHCRRQNRREGRFSFDSMLLIGFLAVFWQDTICNYLRPWFFYNSYMVNFGGWNAHVPGWISPHAQRLPEPWLLSGPIYGWLFVYFAVFYCWAARRVRERWPDVGMVTLFMVGVVSLGIVDTVYEWTVCRAGLWAYPNVIRAVSLSAGKTYQWPLYEGVVVGLFCSTVGMLRLQRDDRGRSSIERGIDRLHMSGRSKAAVATLAFVGLSNVMFVVLNVFYVWVSLYGDPTPVYPSYLNNGLCGQVDYPCPGPGVPITP
jgi:hypothetical protein